MIYIAYPKTGPAIYIQADTVGIEQGLTIFKSGDEVVASFSQDSLFGYSKGWATGAKPDADFNQRLSGIEDKVGMLEHSLSTSVIKDIKIFKGRAAVDTVHQVEKVTVAFPERVDFVATSYIENDGNQMWYYHIDRVDDNVFSVEFRGVNGDGHRWIPALNLLGIQLTY